MYYMQQQQEQDHSQTENEFRNIKLKLKGPNRHSELQAVKALMAMSAQQNVCHTPLSYANNSHDDSSSSAAIISANGINGNGRLSKSCVSTSPKDKCVSGQQQQTQPQQPSGASTATVNRNKKRDKSQTKDHPASLNECDDREALDLSSQQSDSPEPIFGLSITMTEDEFRELAQKEGIKDVIGEPVCRLCGRLFSGPLGIALHMCPAMKRQTYKCEICGEDKWKTKANLHSHIKWCRKRLSMKTDQQRSNKYIHD